MAGTAKETPMKIINLGEADGLPPVDWAAVVDKLESGSAPAPHAINSRTTWLCTVNEDASPHVTAVGAIWLDGAFWFQTGAGTRKGRNVARNRTCSIALSIQGADVVVEGDAERVTQPSVEAPAARAAAGERVPDRAALGDRDIGDGARRPDSLPILTSPPGPHSTFP